MTVLTRVREARMKLKDQGRSEHANVEVVEDLLARAQDLIAQMNEAKLKAIRDAEAPFLEELEQLDREISTFITLVG